MKWLLIFALLSFKPPAFRVLVLAENGGHHVQFSQAAKVWLDKLAADSGFAVDYIRNTSQIDDAFLRRYQLFIQLDYPPYGWNKKAAAAFGKYIDEGRGGWIGFHHATLLGEFDGYPMWVWFYKFMGEIRFRDYIPTFASGKVLVEDGLHPVFKGVPAEFVVQTEEWYTYDRSPRGKVHVMATVDEKSYVPESDKKMGDHPVVWTNPGYKARNVYIFMGHSPDLFQNSAWLRMFTNAIFWASSVEDQPAFGRVSGFPGARK